MTRVRNTKNTGMAQAADSPWFLYYLVLTAVLCGALVMVIEILGSRVIGPFFGASLFVWTSLITVTLIALAAGYAVGGVLSDRKRSPAYLFSIILLDALPPFDRRLVASFPVHRFPTAELNRFLGRTYALPPNTPAVVLTDDYNPIDFYDVKLKEWFRKLILDGVDMDILL